MRELDGVRYVNDSKATNVNAVWYALESFTEPVVLIVGGREALEGLGKQPLDLLDRAAAGRLVGVAVVGARPPKRAPANCARATTGQPTAA